MLEEIRKKAKEFFQSAPAPSIHYGIGIYNDIKNLDWDMIYNHASAEPVVPEPHDCGLITCTLSEALEQHKELISPYFLKDIPFDKFTSLHISKMSEGLVVIVPPNISATMSQIWKCVGKVDIAYLLIIAQEGSFLRFEEESSAGGDYASYLAEIIVQKNAKVEYSTIQQVLQNTFYYTRKHVHVEEGGTIEFLEGMFGSRSAKSEVITNLNGEQATAEYSAIYFSKGKQVFDAHTTLNHNAPNTRSNMVVHGAVKDTSKAIYQGMVRMDKYAKFCSGKQHEQTLILSDTAEADVVPKLEIDNHEVNCSHSAAISSLDEKKLFYLQCRGLSREQAEHMLTKGFFAPFVAKIQQQDIQERLTESIAHVVEQ